MAAKKRSASKKKVTIEIDAETLKKLADAVTALSENANAFILCCDDPGVRAKLPKGPKGAGAKKRAPKKRAKGR